MNSKTLNFSAQELRPEVLAFALKMEQRLRDHDAERGSTWKRMSAHDLTVPACAKILRVESAINKGEPHVVHAVDVANYCMMIADVSGALGVIDHAVGEDDIDRATRLIGSAVEAA